MSFSSSYCELATVIECPVPSQLICRPAWLETTFSLGIIRGMRVQVGRSPEVSREYPSMQVQAESASTELSGQTQAPPEITELEAQQVAPRQSEHYSGHG